MSSLVQIDGIASYHVLPARSGMAVWLSLFLSLCLLSPALACKYTVRDVAFVEMGHSWYRLDLYLDDTTSADYAAQLRSSIELALADSNVRLEVTTIGKHATEESLGHLQALGIQSYPSAVLVSPEGRVRQIALPAQDPTPSDSPSEKFQREIRSAIASVVRSPRRDEILSELMTAHSVVLIIEGEDHTQNLLARNMVENAIARIEAALPDLPKPIDVPPRAMVISIEEAPREAIMLWSLGVDVETDINTETETETAIGTGIGTDAGTAGGANRAAQIAMVFGRGRKLGSVMDVAAIGEQDLLRTLAVVGLDCECDLDRSWMQTPMFPHAWTEADESRAAKSLGFDPGHPLVKVEISRILSRGPSSPDNDGQSAKSNAAADFLLPGLQIIELNFDDEEAPLETKLAAEGGDGRARATSPAGSKPESESGSQSSSRESARNLMPSELAAADSGPTDSDPTDSDPIGIGPVGIGPSDSDPFDGNPIEASQRKPAVSPPAAESAADTSTTSTSRVVSVALVGLVILGLAGGALVMFSGRRNGL